MPGTVPTLKTEPYAGRAESSALQGQTSERGDSNTLGSISQSSETDTQRDDDQNPTVGHLERPPKRVRNFSRGKQDRAIQPHKRLSRAANREPSQRTKSLALGQGQEESHCRVL